jgi:hypothetical protein
MFVDTPIGEKVPGCSVERIKYMDWLYSFMTALEIKNKDLAF